MRNEPDIFHKFPSTPNLQWLGSAPIRGEKVMSTGEVRDFLSEGIVVEEKVDGANVGLSFDGAGHLQFQNRGNWIEGKLSGQWQRLRGWAATREQALREALSDRLIIFGEWCYARHTMAYDCLPDWFLGFDVFDIAAGRFWSTGKRNELFLCLNLQPVPRLASGRISLAGIRTLLAEPSRLAACGPVEGVYLRRENEEWLEKRCKLVNPQFQQAIAEHWSSRPLEPNLVHANVPSVSSERN